MEQQRIEQEKANRIAAVTCSIMSETRNMDAAVRVREMNNAREKIGGEPFLTGDDAIQEAFEWGLCRELVLNETYDETLQSLKDANQERERIEAEKRAEEQRISAEIRAEEHRIAAEKKRIAREKKRIAREKKRKTILKRAEENRIAAEKKRIAIFKRLEEKRIADSKTTVKEEFHSNGKLKSRKNYQPRSDGGKEHGVSEWYYENGELMLKECFKNGRRKDMSYCEK